MKKRGSSIHSCDEPNCFKQFSRLEHLKRHKLNHNPKFIYNCNWPNCSKTFVRKDLKDRHYKRHELQNEKQLNKEKLISLNGLASTETNSSPNKDMIENLNSEGNDELIDWLFNDDFNQFNINGGPEFFTSVDNSILDEYFSSTSIPIISPNSSLSSNFDNHQSTIPKQILITNNNINDFTSLIPALVGEKYIDPMYLTFFMKSYWLIFNPQYPILHFPTFNTQEQNPLLLLCMILIGSNLTECMNNESNIQLLDEFKEEQLDYQEIFKLNLKISNNLRWLIFQNKDFCSPIQIWIFQSLILIEIFEKNYSVRNLHERGHIYHGIIIQLLRRSPTLGGNPIKEINDIDREEDILINNKVKEEKKSIKHKHHEDFYKKWIEQESMKRITYLAFIIDCHDCIKFGHQINLFSYQMQLSLPCHELIWNMHSINDIIKYEKQQSQEEQSSKMFFINYLKNLLINKEFLSNVKFNKRITKFHKKIILAGLISIIYQLQQIELQNNLLKLSPPSSAENLNFENFKKKNFQLIDDLNLFKEDDNYVSDSLNSAAFDFSHYKNNVIFHMAQISLNISHYDIYIFCGAPIRMNVKVNINDYDIVEKRIDDWINSVNGSVAIIHCYLILWESLLDIKNNKLLYNADQDPFKNYHMLGIAVLAMWCYNFKKCGNESNYLNQIGETESKQKLIALEDGYDYLIRIRNNFKTLINSNDFYSDLNYDKILLLSGFLPRIINKKNMVGLCDLVSKILMQSKNELNIENGKLIHSIGERSMGRQFIKCDDMYKK